MVSGARHGHPWASAEGGAWRLAEVPLERATSLVRASLVASGYTPEQADVITDHVMDCELRGVSYGGLARALSIIEHDSPPPTTPIRVIHETPVSATLDGGDQAGYLVAMRATQIALAKAGLHGLAVVGAHNTWYTGMFSYYLEKVAAAGYAGMIAGSSMPFVAPHGGTEARFGTNPIAFAFPADDGAIVWDAGTAGTMYAQVVLARRLGEPLEPGLGFDAAGNSTTDPAAVLADGAVSVWGGHKGSGLASVVQLLGMMTGASSAPEGQRDAGFFLLVFHPGLLGPAEDFSARAAEFAAALRSTRPVEGGPPVRVPFDRSRATRRETLERGWIEVPDEVLAALEAIEAGSTRP